MRGVFVSIVVAAAASLVFAGVAGGGNQGDKKPKFIKTSGNGRGQGTFSFPPPDRDTIQIGRAICRQLTHGNSSLAVSKQILRQKPGVQPDMVVRLVAIAKTAYCPT